MTFLRTLTGAAILLFLLTSLGQEFALVFTLGGLLGVAASGGWMLYRWAGRVTIRLPKWREK